jgi:hypothetical protein
MVAYTARKVRNREIYQVFDSAGHPVSEHATRNAARAHIAELSASEPPKREPPPQYAMRKVRGKDCYKVYSKRTQRIFAKCTTKEKAERQLKLLRALVYNDKFERVKGGLGVL